MLSCILAGSSRPVSGAVGQLLTMLKASVGDLNLQQYTGGLGLAMHKYHTMQLYQAVVPDHWLFALLMPMSCSGAPTVSNCAALLQDTKQMQPQLQKLRLKLKQWTQNLRYA